jgi:uncharacterized protein YebE (UPF0316 family)
VGTLRTLLPLPAIVFVAELVVVTLSTVRIIFLSRGRKVPASVLGFFEVAIWLFAIGQIVQNLSDLGCYVAFAAGFTAGNFFGVMLERRLAIGTLVVRTITHRDPSDLIAGLRAAEYGVTSIDAEGATGPVKVVFTVIPRKDLANVLAIIRAFDPRAFYSVDEIQSAGSGIFPAGKGRLRGILPTPLQPFCLARGELRPAVNGGSRRCATSPVNRAPPPRS